MEAALWRPPSKVSGPDGSVKTSRLAHPRLATQAARGALQAPWSPHSQLLSPAWSLGNSTSAVFTWLSTGLTVSKSLFVLQIHGNSHILCVQMVSMDRVSFFNARALRSRSDRRSLGI